jgi:hypothetical protein
MARPALHLDVRSTQSASRHPSQTHTIVMAIFGIRSACGQMVSMYPSPLVQHDRLMISTSQAFFVLTTLQFSLRNGNFYYTVMCGTSQYHVLQFVLDVVQHAGGPRRGVRAH